MDVTQSSFGISWKATKIPEAFANKEDVKKMYECNVFSAIR